MNKHSKYALEAALRVAQKNADYHRDRIKGLENEKQAHLDHLESAERRIADILETLGQFA